MTYAVRMGTAVGRGCVAAALLALAACSPSSTGADANPNKSIEAQVYCEQFVEDELKAPATAEFIHDFTKEVDPDVWVVTGTVDAENSFGALVRNNYSCRIREIDGSWERLKGKFLEGRG